MKCSKCGKENVDGSLFCVNCGNKLEVQSYKKCIVCGSDFNSDNDTCTVCGCKQDDYVKCLACGEAVLKTFKFCTKCGNPISSSVEDTTSFNTSSVNVNTVPIVEIPDNSNVNTDTINTKPILDNTEVYSTNDFYIPKKKSGGKVFLIIGICVGALALVGVVLFLVFNLFLKDKIMGILNLANNKDVIQEIIDSEDIPEDLLEEVLDDVQEVEIEDAQPQAIAEKEMYHSLIFTYNVKVRNKPTLDGKQVGKINVGSTVIGFNSTESDGHIWYQIGYDEWVAGDSDLAVVSPVELDKVEIIEHESTTVRAKKDAIIYDGPSEDANQIGKLTSTSWVKCFESIEQGGITWLKISPCEYVKYSDFENVY